MLALTTLIFALIISGTAAYFSIIGLATMFPGSVLSIIIMGASLEVGKVLSAIWLHTKWHSLTFLIRTYLSLSLFILMLITSMGIFGFLSKSYVVHEAKSEKQLQQLSQIEKKIERQQFFIAEAQKIIDSQFSQSENNSEKILIFIKQEEDRILKLNTISKESVLQEESNINRWQKEINKLNEIILNLEKKSSLFSSNKKKIEEEKARQLPIINELNKKIEQSEDSIQQIQQENKKHINEITLKINSLQESVLKKNTNTNTETETAREKINKAQKEIDELSLHAFDIKNSSRELEVEIGPVKYIVELFKDFSNEEVTIGFAIRVVILSLIFVFDPLALVLIVTAIAHIERKKKSITLPRETKI